VVLGGEILEADVTAADGLDERGVAEGVLGVGPAAQGGVADDFAGADDANVIGVKRVDEAQAALNPFAFPADLGDGIVGEVGGSADDGVFVQAEKGVGPEGDSAGEVVAGGNERLAAA
jgi:hypothetical protein